MQPARYVDGLYYYTLDYIIQENESIWVIDTVEAAINLSNYLIILNPLIAIDTEFDDVDFEYENPIGKGTIITTQFYWEEDGVPQKVWVDCRDKNVLEALRPFMECENTFKLFQNFSAEYHVFANSGIVIKGLYGDTLNLSRLEDPERESHKLDGDDGLVISLLNEPRGSRPTTKQALGTYKVLKNGTFSKSTIEFMGMRNIVADPEMLPFQMFYAVNDVIDTYKLYPVLLKMLSKTDWNNDPRGLYGFYEDYGREYQTVLCKLMRRGMCIDQEFVVYVKDQFVNHMNELAEKFYEWAGCSLNLNSWEQRAWLLYGEDWKGITKQQIMIYGHGLPIPDVTHKAKKRKLEFLNGDEKKAPSTDADALEYLLENTEGEDRKAIKTLIEYTQHSTVVKLTINSMLERNISRHGSVLRPYDEERDFYRYVHSSLDVATATGRLNSVKPNLQQIPSRGKLGKITRHAFIAEHNQLIICGDWSQVELRILAYYAKMLCGDTSLAEDLVSGDLHQTTADKLSKILDKVIERVVAKAVNFGINYGMSYMKLAADTGMTEDEAKLVIDSYMQTYPGIDMYAKVMIEFARQNGYVQTLFGRIRRLKNIRSKNMKERLKDERRARNTPIQGSAQDICAAAKIAIENDEELKEWGYELRLPVHDELLGVTDKPENEEKIIHRVKWHMENVIPPEMLLGIPLIADVHSGMTWQEAKAGEQFAAVPI